MIPKHIQHHISSWLCVVMAAMLLVLLSACGGGSTSSAGNTTTPTTSVSTPTAVPGGITPTPTAVQAPALTRGSQQTIMITTKSDGSYGFSPAALTIAVGTTVIWKNMSSAPHTVTTDDGQTADSGTFAAGSSFRFTFKTIGAFPYHCNIHPYMRATIFVVQG